MQSEPPDEPDQPARWPEEPSRPADPLGSWVRRHWRRLATAAFVSFLGLVVIFCAFLAEEIGSLGHGRPLRIAGRPLFGRTRRGTSAWSRGDSPTVEGLSPTLRERLAAAWLEDARLEHASIAAFARLSCDLLAVAAPPELIEASNRAAADEVRHARACFALASAYAGAPLGPAAMPEARFPAPPATRASLLRELLRTSILDGVLGEGAAARVAAGGAARAQDPVVREVLEVIAREEAQHAELARQIILWSTSELGAEADAVIEASLRDAAQPASADATSDGDLAEHGRLDALAWRRARTDAIEAFRATRLVLARAA